MFDNVVLAFVFVCAFGRTALAAGSDTSFQLRPDPWIAVGVMNQLVAAMEAALNRLIGRVLTEQPPMPGRRFGGPIARMADHDSCPIGPNADWHDQARGFERGAFRMSIRT